MDHEHDECEEARRLLAPLVSEPTSPSTVDLQWAIAAGRRRLRTRRVAGVSAAAAVTALVVAGVPAALAAVRAPEAPPVASTTTPSPPPSASPTPYPVPTTPPEPVPEPPTSCELDLPPVPADATPSFAFGADPTGRIVYGKYYQPVGDGASITPVLWSDGEAVPLDVPGIDPNIQAVNSQGWAVGYSAGETDEHLAWIYRDGEVTRLAGEDVEAYAITEDGAVLGTRGGRRIPVIWRSPDAPPEDLHVGSVDLRVSEMTADGTVVGFYIGGHSFVRWPDGTVQSIPSPVFDGKLYEFRAQVLDGHLLVGVAWRFQGAGTGSYTATYDLATGAYANRSQDAPFPPSATNRHGWVVGVADDGHAGLWTPEGGLISLPDLGYHSEWFNNVPHWVADDGRTVAGVVETAEGYARAAVWRCS